MGLTWLFVFARRGGTRARRGLCRTSPLATGAKRSYVVPYLPRELLPRGVTRLWPGDMRLAQVDRFEIPAHGDSLSPPLPAAPELPPKDARSVRLGIRELEQTHRLAGAGNNASVSRSCPLSADAGRHCRCHPRHESSRTSPGAHRLSDVLLRLDRSAATEGARRALPPAQVAAPAPPRWRYVFPRTIPDRARSRFGRSPVDCETRSSVVKSDALWLRSAMNWSSTTSFHPAARPRFLAGRGVDCQCDHASEISRSSPSARGSAATALRRAAIAGNLSAHSITTTPSSAR